MVSEYIFKVTLPTLLAGELSSGYHFVSNRKFGWTIQILVKKKKRMFGWRESNRC